MLKRIVSRIGGDPNKKEISAYAEIVEVINAFEPQIEILSDDDLKAKTEAFKLRLSQGESLDDLMPEAFAVVRETSKRILGMRPFDTQLIGGMILHQGRVSEMRTGEGKTLMATLPMYLNALTGDGVHLITVNDYLARRDARWMAPIFDFLGLSVGVLQMGSRTEGGKKAFMVNLEKDHMLEDQHQLEMVDRYISYGADITYGTNNEFGFDYLRDNMRLTLAGRSQRGHNFAIIDEIDNVLIDEARTPLIISGPSHDDAENYERMAVVVKQLRPTDYEVSEKDRTVVLTEIGETRVEQILGIQLRDPDRPEDVTPETARLLGFLEQSLRAQFIFKRNKEYLVQGKQVVIVDDFTGRLMPGRRWSDGLHQAVEAKENVPVQSENITHATITIQNYFRMYRKLSGMTGTAMTEAEEFSDIYSLEVVSVPPIVEYNSSGDEPSLVAHKNKDEYNYEYTYYSHIDDPDQKETFFQRKDYPDVIFRTEEAKFRALITEVIQYQIIGRPMLIGTTSVEASENLSHRMRPDMVRKLMQLLLLRKEWFKTNDRIEDGRMVMALSFLNEPMDKLKTNELNVLAKQLNLNLNVDLPDNINRLIEHLGLLQSDRDRLVQVLKRGVSHQVLNARKHTEESQIIAGAGAFGAVTIATNMAGRGVDIKLGGEIAEEVLSVVNRVLRRNGVEDPFDMSMEERLNALNKLSSDLFGIYEAEINFFIKSMADMAAVKQLGGLHVIGSERHEARRIDNQLRGRAARLGDPGSSRFYLSLEDELMRKFGGQQVDAMMQRLGMDDAMPLEAKIVSNIIESSQSRVEGANFDARKHLLEYDDVLNAQRETIYGQRDKIFVKPDLTGDVREMLETEISRRIPEALEDEDGPWKLLGWLEQIQPTFLLGNVVFPSFTIKLILDSIAEKPHSTSEQALALLLKIANKSISEEEEHILDSASQTLNVAKSQLEEQLVNKEENLDLFFETLRYADEADLENTKQLAAELSATVGFPINFSNQQQQLILSDPDQAQELVSEQIERFQNITTTTRMIGAIERRLSESLELIPNELAHLSWKEFSEEILQGIRNIFSNRRKRLIGDNQDGAIARDLKSQLDKISGDIQLDHIAKLLLVMPQGETTAFDKRTHKQVKRRTTRLSYIYNAALFIEESEPAELTEKVLKQLDNAQIALMQAWGLTVLEQMKENTVGMLDKNSRKTIVDEIGEQVFDQIKNKKLSEIQGPERKVLTQTLGRSGVTEAYRQLLLRVISDLWIEYLTKVEALRVSIGLEAYAQRDPLVQYKAKASELFAQLFKDMRLSVVSRMFNFRPRQQAQPQNSPSVPQPKAVQAGSSGSTNNAEGDPGKRKRKRKRRK